MIGFASGRIPSLPVNLALVKGLTNTTRFMTKSYTQRLKGFSVIGVRSFAQLAFQPHLQNELINGKVFEKRCLLLSNFIATDCLKWANERKLVPYIYRVYSLSNYKDAFRAVANREVIGKAIIEIQSGDVSAKL